MENLVAFQVRYEKDYEHVLKMVKNAGFKYVSIGFGNEEYLLDGDYNKKIAKLKTDLKENDLTCVFTHSPYYDPLISAEILDEKKEYAQELSLIATKELGADIIAFHPRSYIKNGVVDNRKSLEINAKNFKPIIEKSKKLGVEVALENLCTFPDHEEKFYPQTAKDLIELVRALDGKPCVVWDFGHAHLNKNDQVKDILSLNKLIKATHTHSNNLDNDYHLSPYSGSTEWDSIMKAVKEIGYEGYLTLEVDYKTDTVTQEFIKNTYKDVIKLYKMIKK